MQEDLHPKMYLYRRIVEAKRYIDKHYAQKIELESISEQACFSKYHFHRLFTKVYGKSPSKYLTEVRIHQAQKLLTQGLTVTEVCEAVGFDSVPSFTHLFKRCVGVTPKIFSEDQQKISDEARKAPLQFIPPCFAENFGWNK